MQCSIKRGENSDQLDVTLENSKIVKLALTWVVTTQRDGITYRSCRLFRMLSSKRKCKAEGYHTVCAHFVAVSHCLPATTEGNQESVQGADYKRSPQA